MGSKDEFFGLQVRFRSKPGQRAELETILLEAANGMCQLPDCRLYLVSRAAADADTLWVTEVWTSGAAHEASLEKARDLIGRALALFAEPPSANELRPVGGKGLSRRG